ncbi:transposase [Neisseria sp. HMSC064E01]|nr:transposase [Neisseria sp. HMSC064E01]
MFLDIIACLFIFRFFFITCYSGLNLNQDKATKPKTVQMVRQGEATPYWFKIKPL